MKEKNVELVKHHTGFTQTMHTHYSCTHTCVHVCTHTHTHTHMQSCTHTHAHALAHTHPLAHTYHRQDICIWFDKYCDAH